MEEERTTGATEAQILAAVPRFHAHFGTLDRFEVNAPEATRNNAYMTIDEAADFLVPPDLRIVSGDDLAAASKWLTTFCPTYTDGSDRWELHALITRINALIGGVS